MKNSIKRAQSQARLSFAERENFRPKVKQLKKTLLTLVALLAVTTGAWAQTETLLTTITPTAKTTYSETTPGVVTVTHDNSDFYEYGWVWWGNPGSVTVVANEGYTISKCVFYQNSKTVATISTSPFKINFIYNDDYDEYICEGSDPKDGIMNGVTSIEVYGPAAASPSSGPEVTWTAATKTGSFTMPGGNVTLEPDYYPQATAAEGAVTAATDAKATTDAPLVTIDETKLTGAKNLMYYVSTDATAPAYDAEGWTDVLPTAENYTEAATLNVWYYPVGTDEGTDGATATYSDGDICATALTVSLGAAPTYAVTFADDLTEPTLWTASPATGVTKGTEVTVTYTGSKKVIGVKAEKKAAVTYPLLSAVTTEDYGKVVCADGHLHDAKTAVPDGCTAVGIIGKVTETGHGLILALKDATSQNWNTINGWTSASYAGTTLKVLPDDGARSTNLASYSTLGETAVSNWAVAQKSDYDAIFTNLGSTTGDTDGKTYDANVNAYITTGVGGTAIDGHYRSATEKEGGSAWGFASSFWSGYEVQFDYNVRPVLGF